VFAAAIGLRNFRQCVGWTSDGVIGGAEEEWQVVKETLSSNLSAASPARQHCAVPASCLTLARSEQLPFYTLVSSISSSNRFAPGFLA
jgi:hypothetical protein